MERSPSLLAIIYRQEYSFDKRVGSPIKASGDRSAALLPKTASLPDGHVVHILPLNDKRSAGKMNRPAGVLVQRYNRKA
jgi:hypothetical protein